MINGNPSSNRPSYYIFTDFGPESVYVGQMKAVIKSINPAADLITLSNTVPRQDPLAAAFLLKSSLPYIQEGGNLLCVIDPGVGTQRPIVVLETRYKHHTLVGPDNGMFGFLNDDIHECRVVENTDFMLDDISNTFHGRDVMAPVLAHLNTGTELSDIGPEQNSVKTLDNPNLLEASVSNGVILGQIVYDDPFGNLITNISANKIDRMIGNTDEGTIHVKSERVTIDGLSKSYSDVEPEALLALIGSSGYLEISVNQGSASDELNLSPGDPVTVSCE